MYHLDRIVLLSNTKSDPFDRQDYGFRCTLQWNAVVARSSVAKHVQRFAE